MNLSLSERLFRIMSLEEATDLLAQHFPQGRVWDKKNEPDSNTRKFLAGLAKLQIFFQKQVKHYIDELDIDKTFDLLEEYKESVALPDECFSDDLTLEQTREYIKVRISKRPIVTLQDIQEFVEVFFPDITITLYPGDDFFSFERSFETVFGGGDEDLFILVVSIADTEESFEYEFEHDFGGYDKTRLECLLRKVIPANCALFFTFEDIPQPQDTSLTAGNGTILTSGNGLILQAGNQ